MVNLDSDRVTGVDNIIQTDSPALFKLSFRQDIPLALTVQSKPVFGANITLHKNLLAHASYILSPADIVGWVDSNSLSYFEINNASDINHNKYDVPCLPSQFFTCERGVIKVTKPTRINLIAKNSDDILRYGQCFFAHIKTR